MWIDAEFWQASEGRRTNEKNEEGETKRTAEMNGVNAGLVLQRKVHRILWSHFEFWNF